MFDRHTFYVLDTDSFYTRDDGGRVLREGVQAKAYSNLWIDGHRAKSTVVYFLKRENAVVLWAVSYPMERGALAPEYKFEGHPCEELGRAVEDVGGVDLPNVAADLPSLPVLRSAV
jgi:hypothetical protein